MTANVARSQNCFINFFNEKNPPLKLGKSSRNLMGLPNIGRWAAAV
jgi:hypothetical protein